MIKSIWLKEYIKLKKILVILLLIHIAVSVYYFITLRGGFEMITPVQIWSDIIAKNSIFFYRYEAVFYGTAITLGVFQFLPEVIKRSFRISCHLPMNEYIMVASTISFSIIFLTLLFVIDTVLICIVSSLFFPYDIYSLIPKVMLYWYLEAILIYMIASILTLEPLWKNKIRIAILIVGIVTLVDVSVYKTDIYYVLIVVGIVLISIPIIYYPAIRFRKGVM